MEALEDFLRNTKSDEHHILVNLGNALVKVEQKEIAIASYDRAIELKSDKDEAENN